MAAYLSSDNRKVTTHRLIEMKQRGEKISMLTSYDYTTAQIVDGAGVDVILVGDSASNVIAGNITTLPISLDQMIFLGKAVVRGVKRALGRYALWNVSNIGLRCSDQCHPNHENYPCRCFETGRWGRGYRFCKENHRIGYPCYGTPWSYATIH